MKLAFLIAISITLFCSATVRAQNDVTIERPFQVADLFDNVKNKAIESLQKAYNANKTTSESHSETSTNQSSVEPKSQREMASQSGMTPQGNDPKASSLAATEGTINGLWVSRNGGWNEIINIDGNAGVSMKKGQTGLFDVKGEQVLKIKRTKDTSFTGQLLFNNSSWQSVAGKLMQDGSLLIKTNSTIEYRLERLPPPPKPEGNVDLVETASSGTSYHLIKCQSDFSVQVYGHLPKNIDVRDWPSEKIYKDHPSVSEAAPFIEEAKLFASKACPKFANKLEFIVFSYENLAPSEISNTASVSKFAIMITNVGGGPSWEVLNAIKDNEAHIARIRENNQRVVNAKAVDNQRSIFVKRYDAVVLNDESLSTLHSNPFVFKGKNVALDVNFIGMQNASTAQFEQLAGMGFHGSRFIIADHIPNGIFSGQSKALLIGKVVGLKKMEDLQGYSALHLQFIAVKLCSAGNSCF